MARRNKKHKKKEPSLYDIAMKMMDTAFKPALRESLRAVQAATAHGKAGGGLDKAYDGSAANIRGAQDASTANANTQAAVTEDAAGMGVDAAAKLGAEQVARTQQQAKLYGQTAEAALEATNRAGAHVGTLSTAGANSSGFLRALGAVQGQLGVSEMSANEARRGEARTDLSVETGKRRDALTDLRAEKAGKAGELAGEMQKEEREYLLALETLGLKERDSRRDFRATLRGIAEQRAQRDTNDANADEDRAVDDENADADRVAKHDMDGDGDIDGRDKRLELRHERAGGGGSGAGRYTSAIYVGRDNKKIAVTPGQRAKQVEKRQDISEYFHAANRRLGKFDDVGDARKDSGLKNRALFDLGWEMAARKKAGQKHTIPRSYLPMLKSMFFQGHLPSDIAKMVVPPGKG